LPIPFCVSSRAIESRFIEHFADPASFEKFAALAGQDHFDLAQVAARLAPEYAYRERLQDAMGEIAARLADPDNRSRSDSFDGLFADPWDCAPLPLGQSAGDAGQVRPAPGRQPGRRHSAIARPINHETHLQGLSPQHFMGRIQLIALARPKPPGARGSRGCL